MAKTRRIRQRMLYIVLLGVLTSAGSLIALMRIINAWTEQRGERARDAVLAEVERLAKLPPSADSLGQAPIAGYVGVRGGWLTPPLTQPHTQSDDGAQLTLLPPVWRAAITDTAQAAVRAHGKVAHVVSLPKEERLFIAAMPTAPGPDAKIAWIGNLLPPGTWIHTWRLILWLVSAATLLLASTALWSMFAFRSNARALSETLSALAKDLSAPVPEPDIAELTGIADGVRAMAAELLASREATEKLTRQLTQKERLAALGRVAAGVAHEVRNPLASIKLRLDLTLAGAPLGEASRKSIVAASDEIARLDRLVSDLLVVAGRQPGPRTLVALAPLVRARAESLLPWAEQRQVAVQVEEVSVVGRATPEMASVVDEASLSRALDNLLRNAIEASPSGQAVRVRVEPVGDAAGDDEKVQITVEDCGGGVDDARVPELFEPFFTTKPEGTGLGLAISRAIARAHGGDLTYARVGSVTRFTLVLVRSRQMPTAHPVGAAS